MVVRDSSIHGEWRLGSSVHSDVWMSLFMVVGLLDVSVHGGGTAWRYLDGSVHGSLATPCLCQLWLWVAMSMLVSGCSVHSGEACTKSRKEKEHPGAWKQG